jgi:hypothetical protein
MDMAFMDKIRPHLMGAKTRYSAAKEHRLLLTFCFDELQLFMKRLCCLRPLLTLDHTRDNDSNVVLMHGPESSEYVELWRYLGSF